MRFDPVRSNPLRRSRASDARSAGESAICPGPEQPSAEIVRVGCAKCRRECDLLRSGATLCGDRTCRMRECDLSRSRATLCGDRGCRMREMQARVRFGFVRRNPLRRSCVSRARNAGERRFGFVRRNLLQRSCVSSARNAGESAICPGRGQPSAEIVRVDFVVVQLRGAICGAGS